MKTTIAGLMTCAALLFTSPATANNDWVVNGPATLGELKNVDLEMINGRLTRNGVKAFVIKNMVLSDNIRAKAAHKPGAITFWTETHRWTVELMPRESDIYNKTSLSPKETSNMLALGVALGRIVSQNAGYGTDFKVKSRGQGWHKVTFKNNRQTTLPAMVHGRVLKNGRVNMGKVSDYRVSRWK